MRTVLMLSLALLPRLVHAENSFVPIPADQTGGQSTGLEIKIVQYHGGTNGELTVEVRNPTDKEVEFVAKGLYFVPNGSANNAPQRLGAVGPFQEKTGQGWQRREKMTIEKGATVRMKLD